MVTETRYLNQATHVVNSRTFKKLTTTLEQNQWFEQRDVAGEYGVCQWFVRVYKRTQGGIETEITSGYTLVGYREATLLGSEGLQEYTWNCPETALNVTDNIMVAVYMRINYGSYSFVAVWGTEQLGTTKLWASIWTFRLWTNGFNSDGYSYFTFQWGSSNYPSRIENFQYGVLVNISDSLSLADQILRNKTVNISDSINASDVLTRNKPSIPILDAVALTEALRKDCMLKVADSISMFETVLRNRSVNVQDSINLLEYLAKTRMLTVSDLINLQDTVGRSKTLTLADSVTLTDAVTVYFVHLIKHVADALSLSEVVYANKVLKVNENVYVADDAKVDKRLYVTDQITLADLLLRHKLSVVADLIQVSDVQGIIINKLLRVSDSIAFVELIVSGKVHFVLIINQLETLQAHIEEALRESSVTDEEFNADVSEKEYSSAIEQGTSESSITEETNNE